MSVWDFVRDPASVRLLVEFGEAKGVSSAQLLKRTGLERLQLDDPNVALEASQELLVIANLMRALKYPPQLGLEVGMQYGFTTYGIWGYGLISSATVGEALNLALRFLPLTYAFALISVGEVNGEVILKFGEPDVDEDVRSFLTQRDMAAAARLISELAGNGFKLNRIMLREPPPDRDRGRGQGREMWGAVIEFGCHMNAIVCDAAVLQVKLPNANPLTAAMCQQLCMSLMEGRRARQGASTLVRSYLQVSCGNNFPDLPTMARHLYWSERTLKRRLQAEGTSFRQLQTEVRRQLAQDLLSDGTLSISEIATRLGFSDQSSFSQAYKRWHGVAPSVERSKSVTRERAF